MIDLDELVDLDDLDELVDALLRLSSRAVVPKLVVGRAATTGYCA